MAARVGVIELGHFEPGAHAGVGHPHAGAAR